MKNGGYLVIEYAPSLLDNREFYPVRMDGHYADRDVAEAIADGWAAETTSEGSRIIVAEVVSETKRPADWN
ncbi:hypothetical protein ACUXV3_12330 [Roseobacteraceae bacterium NS-SX3]